MTVPNFVQKLLHEYFRWTVLGVVALFFVLGYVVFLNAKITAIQTTSFADRSRAQNDLTRSQNYVASLQKTLDTYRQSFPAAMRERLDQLLPEETDFPTNLLTVKNMAKTAGLELSAITVSEVAPTVVTTDEQTPVSEDTTDSATKSSAIPNLRAYDVSISVQQGTGYENFKQFIKTLESSEPLYDVQTLNFTASSDAESTATYTFVIRTYALPEVTEPTT